MVGKKRNGRNNRSQTTSRPTHSQQQRNKNGQFVKSKTKDKKDSKSKMLDDEDHETIFIDDDTSPSTPKMDNTSPKNLTSGMYILEIHYI